MSKTSLATAFAVARKKWGGNGSGSTEAATAKLVSALPDLFKRHGVKTMIDLGCGDATWIMPIARSLDAYLGCDVVPSVIEANAAAAAGTPSVKFATVTTETYLISTFRELHGIEGPGEQPSAEESAKRSPHIDRVDLVLLRDCLAHLPTELVTAVLKQAAAAGRLVLATSFRTVRTNGQIKAGAFRPLNLQGRPINLPEPLEWVQDSHPKQLGLWSAEQL